MCTPQPDKQMNIYKTKGATLSFLSHSLQSMYSELPTFINALRLLLSVISGMNQNETAEKDTNTHTHTRADVSNASV